MNEYTKIFMEAYGDSAFNEDTVEFAILESASAELIAYQPVTEGLGDAIMWVIRKISDIVKAIIKLIVKAISTIGKAIKRLIRIDNSSDEEVVKSVEKNNKALNDIHKSNVDLKKRMEEDERELRERKARYDKIVKDSEERRRKMIEDSERSKKDKDILINGLHSGYASTPDSEFVWIHKCIDAAIRRIETFLNRDNDSEPLAKFHGSGTEYSYGNTDIEDQTHELSLSLQRLERNNDRVFYGNKSSLKNVLNYLMNEDSALKSSLDRLQQLLKSLESKYSEVSKRFEAAAAASGYSKEKAYEIVNKTKYHWMEDRPNETEEFRANLKYIKSWNLNIDMTKDIIGIITKAIAILLKDQQKIAAVGIDM